MTERIVRSEKVAGVTFDVTELTVSEIRAWVSSSNPEDFLDATLIEGALIQDIKRCTSLTDGQIGSLTPRQLRECFEKAREVNPDFFQVRGRQMAFARQAAASN